MIKAVRAAGGRPRYTEVPGLGHDVWKVVYNSDELYQWMLNPKPAQQTQVPLAVKPGAKQFQPEETEPFIPAVEVPGAVFVRLGNDVLDAVAYALPDLVPSDSLTGTVPDVYDSTVAQGRVFNITFSGLSYSARLTEARLRATDSGTLDVQLGLEDLQLTIATTYVTGASQSAVAGPITVSAGFNGPVWLKLKVRPRVEHRRLRLELVSSDFSVPWENYTVSWPAWVSTRGLGMTRRKVAQGLVDGLYSNRQRFEEQVKAAVPGLLEKLEENLDWSKAASLVQSFWPLPVYKPRVRLWPTDVAVDAKGVSLTLGVTAAAADPKAAPKQPAVLSQFNRPAASLPQTEGLRVGLAPGLLQPLTELLIQADVARIHVKDIPQPEFAVFADRAVMSEILPDLKQPGEHVELWSEVVLAEPLQVLQSKDRRFTFYLPKLLLSVAVRSNGKEPWRPYAEFELSVRQSAEAEVVRPAWNKRALRLKWTDGPKVEVHARFAPGYTPVDSKINLKRFQQLFVQAWRAWTSQGVYAQTEVPDVTFGVCRLRLERAGGTPPFLFVEFQVPTIQLTNTTDVPVTYKTKGPRGTWGGPYTLEAHSKHTFRVPYALLYKRETDEFSEFYKLPVGAECEFRQQEGSHAPRLFLLE